MGHRGIGEAADQSGKKVDRSVLGEWQDALSWLVGEDLDSMEYPVVAKTATDRKDKSEKVLLDKNIPFDPDVPPLPEAQDVKPRSSKEVARRAVVIWAVTNHAITAERVLMIER